MWTILKQSLLLMTKLMPQRIKTKMATWSSEVTLKPTRSPNPFARTVKIPLVSKSAFVFGEETPLNWFGKTVDILSFKDVLSACCLSIGRRCTLLKMTWKLSSHTNSNANFAVLLMTVSKSFSTKCGKPFQRKKNSRTIVFAVVLTRVPSKQLSLPSASTLSTTIAERKKFRENWAV